MRRIKFWHIALVGLGLLAFFSAFEESFKGDHIARIHITGGIDYDPYRHDLLEKIANNNKIKAVLVHIESPGGSAAASESIYEDLRAIAAKKPVVALIGGVAASGGYVVALGADRIFARPTAITGSIGVIFQWSSMEGLAKKIGVEPQVVRSGALKAKPDFFKKADPKTLRHIKKIVDSTFDWFITLVADRRNRSRAEVLAKAGDGRIFTGTLAFEANLIDEIGGETEGRAWLESQHQLPLDMAIESYKAAYPTESFRSWAFDSALAVLSGPRVGRQPSATALKPLLAPQQGLLLLWQY